MAVYFIIFKKLIISMDGWWTGYKTVAIRLLGLA